MLCFCLCKRENIKDPGTFFSPMKSSKPLGTRHWFVSIFFIRSADERSDLWHYLHWIGK